MPNNSLSTGRRSGIGPSGIPISDRDLVASNGVIIYSDKNNTDYIYIGNSGLTADSNDVTDGFPMSSGDALFLEHRNPENLFVRSKTDISQKIWWILQ